MGHKHKIDSWKDCRDPKNVKGFVKENGCAVVPGSGDHEIIKTPTGASFTIYNREMSTGVACSLFKWLKYVGLLGAIIVLAIIANIGG
jgi:hypothetical protein